PYARFGLGVRIDAACRRDSRASGRGDRAEVRPRAASGGAGGTHTGDPRGLASTLPGTGGRGRSTRFRNRERGLARNRYEDDRKGPREPPERPLVLIHFRVPAN